MDSNRGSTTGLRLQELGAQTSFADMQPRASAQLIAQYLRERLREVPGVIGVICGEGDQGQTITVVVEELHGPTRRQVHDAFYAVREALQPTHVDMTVAQGDTL